MIRPRWLAAAFSSFSINNCVHKNDNDKNDGTEGCWLLAVGIQSPEGQQQGKMAKQRSQRSVQAENQLRDSLICMLLSTLPIQRRAPVFPSIYPDETSRQCPCVRTSQSSPCGCVCDSGNKSVASPRHSG